MSLLRASQEGYLIALDSQQEYIDAAMEAYTVAQKEIDALLAESYAKLAGISPDKYWGEMVKKERYKQLSADIATAYKEASKIAIKNTIAGLESVLTENYGRQLYLDNWMAPELTPVAMNTKLIKYTVTGNINYWNDITAAAKKHMDDVARYAPQAGTLTELLTKSYTKELDTILQTVQNGFITGKSYKDQAKSISGVIGKYIRKTDSATGAKYNALRIARTEGQRVANVGALQAAKEAEAQGIEVQKEWSATLDSVTRSSHQSLDGQRVDIDKPFHSPESGATGQAPGQMSLAGDNINCRCSTITIVEGQSPEVRRARDPLTGKNEIISYKSYDQWAKDKGI
jgi:hypothetical protein